MLFVKVSLSQNEVTVVQHTSNATKDSDLVQLISQLGFTACSPMNGCQTATIDIDGMTCISCVRSIEACLSDVEGIKASNVSLSDNCALLVIDSSVVTVEQICDAVNSCGFVAKSRFQGCNDTAQQCDISRPDPLTGTIHIEGMICDSCVKNIENNISQLPGVISIAVSLPDKLGTVKFNSAITSVSAIAKEISEMGFQAEGGQVLDGLHPNAKDAVGDEAERSQCSSAVNDVVINISGMTCDSCVKSVNSCISNLPGVRAVNVSLADGLAYVSLCGRTTSAADVASAVNDIGFDASVFQPPDTNSTIDSGPGANAEILMAIRGMHCNSCTRSIEAQVSGAAAVHSIVVSLLDETAKIQYNPQLISADQLKQLIKKAGTFEASIISETSKYHFSVANSI